MTMASTGGKNDLIPVGHTTLIGTILEFDSELVVPDESLRWKAAIVAAGRVTPGLAEAIAGSFHVLMAFE